MINVRNSIVSPKILEAIYFLLAYERSKKYSISLIQTKDPLFTAMGYIDEELDLIDEKHNKIVLDKKDEKCISALIDYEDSVNNSNNEKYPMCDDQLAQIDCRKEECRFNNMGHCNNISPAITLNNDDKFICWSEEFEIQKGYPSDIVPDFEYTFMGYCLDGWEVDDNGNLYWAEGADE